MWTKPPVITPAGNITRQEGGAVTLTAYSARDPEGIHDSFVWTLEGEDAAAFAINAAGVLRFADTPDYDVPADRNRDNVYLLTVRADDPDLTGRLDVVVTVTDVNEPPVVTGHTDIARDENVAGPLATYSATDPEGVTALVWSLAGDDASHFGISAGGVLTFNTPPDFDARADRNRDNVYLVTVRASDGSHVGALQVRVTIGDINEPPVVTGPARVDNYPENSSGRVGTYSKRDPEGAGVTWSALGGDDAEHFELSNAGVLTFKTPPDVEEQETYRVRLNAFDGQLTGRLDVVVTVTDVNEPPVVTGNTDIARDENVAGPLATYSATDPEGVTALVWSLAGDDASHFGISGGRRAHLHTPPDFDARADRNRDNVYLVTVRASDGSHVGALQVRVTIGDINEPPVVTGPARVDNYPENSSGRVGTYSKRDPEGAGVTWSALGGDDAEHFELSNAGVLTFKTPPDVEEQETYRVRLNAFDGQLTGRLDVVVTVTDVNEPPVVTGHTDIARDENVAGPLATYSATDPEGVTALVWSLAGDDASHFGISAGGVLTFNTPPDFDARADRNRDNVYLVTVRASDGSHVGALQVRVTIGDINEPPVVTGPARVDNYPENSSGRVGTYSKRDPEGAGVTWSALGGDDAEHFELSNAGVLTFKTPPDVEEQETYRVRLNAFDGQLTGRLDVVVTVTDVNEPPVVSRRAGSDSTISVVEGSGTFVGEFEVADPRAMA